MSDLLPIPQLFSQSWAAYRARQRTFAVYMIVLLAATLLGAAGIFAATMPNIVADMLYPSYHLYSELSYEMVHERQSIVFLISVIGIAFAVIFGILTLILKSGFLRIAFNSPGTSITQLFKEGARRLLPLLAAWIILGIIVQLGTWLFVIPGIIFALMFSQTLMLTARGSGPIDAFKQSAQLTRGRWLALLGRYLLITLCGTALIIPAIIMFAVSMDAVYSVGLVLTLIAGLYSLAFIFVVVPWQVMYAKTILDSTEKNHVA